MHILCNLCYHTRSTFIYWWFAYNVIKNTDFANYDQAAPNFGISYQTTTCLCTKFEVIWTNENRVMGQRSWRFFYYVIWENRLKGILLPTNMAAEI